MWALRECIANIVLSVQRLQSIHLLCPCTLPAQSVKYHSLFLCSDALSTLCFDVLLLWAPSSLCALSYLGWAATWWMGPAEGALLAVVGAALAGMWAQGLPQAKRNELMASQVWGLLTFLLMMKTQFAVSQG